nr:YheV family putative zinc ribbon protein [Sinobacterium caligoides]
MVKRFVAGAVCPRCSEMDKIKSWNDDEGQHRECVSCGYSDVMNDQVAQQEVDTRVNQSRPGEQPLAHEDEVQVVQLMDPGSMRKDH